VQKRRPKIEKMAEAGGAKQWAVKNGSSTGYQIVEAKRNRFYCKRGVQKSKRWRRLEGKVASGEKRLIYRISKSKAKKI
jgi:hypothetical protein